MSKPDDIHYTRINFINTPLSPEIDIEFSVQCQDSAMVNISVGSSSNSSKFFFHSFLTSFLTIYFSLLRFRKKRIQEILMKSTTDITKEEKDILKRYKNLAKLVQSQRRNHNLRKEREQEIEDDINTLRYKCTQLVELIRSSNHIIVYTGAGISTSASIPDYRGPNGVWTRIKNGDNTPNVNDLAFSGMVPG